MSPPLPPSSRRRPASLWTALASLAPTIQAPPPRRARKDPRTAASVTSDWNAVYSPARKQAVTAHKCGHNKRVAFSSKIATRVFAKAGAPCEVASIEDQIVKVNTLSLAVGEAATRLYWTVRCARTGCMYMREGEAHADTNGLAHTVQAKRASAAISRSLRRVVVPRPIPASQPADLEQVVVVVIQSNQQDAQEEPKKEEKGAGQDTKSW